MLKLKITAIALAAAAAVLTAAAAPATTIITINFDEVPAANNNVGITTLYSGLGVTFSGTNAGIWDGISEGDPGNWDVEGTNGPQFLGFNSPYMEVITFSTPITSFTFDISATRGTPVPGGGFLIFAYSGSDFLGMGAAEYNGINDWNTGGVLANGAIIDRIELLSGGGDYPFALDNIVIVIETPVPEPASWALLIAGFGLTGAAMRRRKMAVSFA